MEPGHLLHSALTRPSSANARRLKSRHPFVPAAQQLISSSDDNSIRAALWADYPPPRRYWKFSLLFAQMKHGRFCYLSVAHRPPHGLHGLTVLRGETIDWLLVGPNNGLKELAQTITIKQLVLVCCRHSHLNQPRCAVFFMCWIN